METNIYNFELLNLKKQLLEEMYYEIKTTVLPKTRSNSKSFLELKKFVNTISTRIEGLDNEIMLFFNNNKEKHSTVKIKTETLKNIIELRHELEINSISELLKIFVDNYRDLMSLEKLVEIKSIVFTKKNQNTLNKSNFYISKNEFGKGLIVYNLDDLIIYNNIEYLNLEIFKKFSLGTENFLFSPKYTLQDIDDFKSIWDNILW